MRNYLLVFSAEREDPSLEERVVELLPRRVLLSELRTPEEVFLSLLSVLTLLRRVVLLLLSLVLVLSALVLREPLLLPTLRRVLFPAPFAGREEEFTLSRLLPALPVRLVVVVAFPTGRVLELGRIFTEPKSERREV